MNGGNDRKNIFSHLSLILQIGLTVIVPTMAFTFLGVWLDHRFGTWFTIPLVIFGMSGGVAGAWSLIRKSNLLKDEPEEKYDLMAGWHEEEKEERNEDRTEKSHKKISVEK